MTASKEVPVFSIRLGGGFMLLFALIYFFDEQGLVGALIPPVLAHELGHILFMLIFGASPSRLTAAMSGFSIDYSGNISEKQEALTALAGPVAGLSFSFLSARLGALLGSEYLLMCGGLGFILNAFNLLPALPLDGGRVLSFVLGALFGRKKARAFVRVSGLITAFTLFVAGVYMIFRGYGFALFLAGVWLFVLQQNKSCK